MAPDQCVWIALGHLLDVHPAHAGEHREQLLLGSVEDDRRVVLGGDVRGALDPQVVDGEAANVHAEDRIGMPAGLRLIGGDLDASRLPALADPYLSLDHARVADLVGGIDSLLDRARGPAVGNGHTVAREQLLSLVLVEIHRGRGL